MTNQLLRRISLLLFIQLFIVAQAFSSASVKAKAKVDKSQVTVGESTALSVTVSGMDEKDNKNCNYTITIPDGLLNGTDQSEITTKEIKGKWVGKAGNGTHDHGTYTTNQPGEYTFKFEVEKNKGNKDGEDPIVTFHPGAPSNLVVSDITPSGFTATWDAGIAAESYTIILERAGLEPIELTDITTIPYPVTGLDSEAEYICKVKSAAAGLLSLKPSNSVLVTTGVRPIINREGNINTFSLALGDSAAVIQRTTISGVHLQGDISLSLQAGNPVYSIDKNTIAAGAQETVTITFTPTQAGTYNDTLIITSLHADEMRIPLTGRATLKKPEANEALDIKASSFTANWKEVPFAEEYLLSVLDESKTPLEGYNKLSVGANTTYVVEGLFPESTYSYTVYAVNNKTESTAATNITVNTAAGAAIVYNQLEAFTAATGKESTKTLRIYGLDLTEKITLELETTDEFSIDKNELEAAGGFVLITYKPETMAEHTATLTLRSADNQSVVTLTGHGLPKTTIPAAANNITDHSFVANWAAQDAATDYLLTVKLGEEIIVDNRSTQGATSLPVENLKAGQTYTYTVKVVENGLISPDSDPVSVTTCAAPQTIAYPEKTAIRVIWPAVVGADKYKAFLYKDDTPVEGYNGIETQETSFVFDELEASTAYSYEIASLFGDNEYSTGKISAQTGGYYGEQLKNLGFEDWDYVGQEDEEPQHWNSFMTGSGTYASFAKTQKVKISNLKRPDSEGEKSAVIWSTSTMGITANGNLTTGRIIANSMSATNVNNHNKTVLDDPDFNAPFKGAPDSLTVWVRFVPGNSADSARVAAAIHDDYPYQDPNDQVEIEQHVFSKAECNYAAANDNAWQRITMPFNRTGNNVNPEYMLVSFTTNKTPGKGNANDSVYIDDMLMVYQPAISIATDKIDGYLLGSTIDIPFNLTGTMSPYNLNAEPNMVYLELSDAQGSFTQARRIAQLTTDYSGTLSAQLPEDLEAGTQYRIRIVTTNYPMISEPSEPFSIIASLPEAPVAKEATDITIGSFTANWNAVEGTTGYIVSIAGKDYIVEGANTTSLEITNLTPETDYSYTVKAAIGSLTSDASNEIKVQTEAGGLITSIGNTSLTTTNSVSARETLTIKGSGLISWISASVITEDESNYFTINNTKLSKSGGNITLTYNPKALGVHSATLVLASPFTDTVKVALAGKALPKTIKTSAAENITPTSFTARWEAGSDAEAYLLTIQNQAGEIVDGYNNLNVGDTTAYSITELSPDTEYTYSIIASAQDMESVISNKTTVKTLVKPFVSATSDKTDFVQDINTSDIANVTVQTADLIGSIVSTSLTGSKHFSMQLISDEELIINYVPGEAGKDTATLTINTAYADPATIIFSGIARPLPVTALNASQTTYDSFIAHWEAATDADAYLLTVKDNRDRIVGDYDQKNVGAVTSIEINDLKRLTDYTYYVEVLKNEVTSLPSNTIEVRTVPGSSGLSSANSADVNIYPNPVKNHIYVTGAPMDQEYIIIDMKGLIITRGEMQGNKINVENLVPNMYILRIGLLNLPFIKE